MTTTLHEILHGSDPDQGELYANFKPVRYRYVMTYLHDELEHADSGDVLHKAGELMAILPMTSVSYGIGMYVGTEMSGNVALPEMTLILMPHPPGHDFERRPHPDRSGNPVGAMFECGNRGIYVMRNEEVVWGGILWTRNYTSGTPQLPVTALSFDGYIYYRLLRLTIDFRAVTNMYAIWWAVLRHTFNDFDSSRYTAGLTGRDVVSETNAAPSEEDTEAVTNTAGTHLWKPHSDTNRKCKVKVAGVVCNKHRSNPVHTNQRPENENNNSGGGTGGGGGGGHPATWHAGPGSGGGHGGGGGGGHHSGGGGGTRMALLEHLESPQINPLADEEEEEDPDPVADEESTPHFMQWTGITAIPYSNAPFVNFKHSWPNNSMDIELPRSDLKLFNDRGEMTATKRWHGYDMPFVGPLLQEWADTETVASFEGGKRFEYKVVCWYDDMQQRFRQRYICGEMHYPDNQDPNNPQPDGILYPLLGRNTKLMAQSPDNALVFDFPGSISSWSLSESMEEAATRYLVSDGFEEATKHVKYGWDAQLLDVPSSGNGTVRGSQGWRLYDKTTGYDIKDNQQEVQNRADALITMFKVPQAMQLRDLIDPTTVMKEPSSMMPQRTSARSTSLSITLYTDPSMPLPEFKLGDWATFAIEDPFYGGKMYLVRRIIGYTVQVVPEQESDYSHESITLELTDDTQIALS